MIITFSVDKNGKQRVGVNGSRPIEQMGGGCRTMFILADMADGISFSDEPIEGWNNDHGWDGSYVHPSVAGFGAFGQGYIERTFLDAIGFKDKPGKMCWSAENNLHKTTSAQAREYVKRFHADKAGANEYILGLYPKVQDNPPTPMKKGRAKKGMAQISLSV